LRASDPIVDLAKIAAETASASLIKSKPGE